MTVIVGEYAQLPLAVIKFGMPSARTIDRPRVDIGIRLSGRVAYNCAMSIDSRNIFSAKKKKLTRPCTEYSVLPLLTATHLASRRWASARKTSLPPSSVGDACLTTSPLLSTPDAGGRMDKIWSSHGFPSPKGGKHLLQLGGIINCHRCYKAADSRIS